VIEQVFGILAGKNEHFFGILGDFSL